MVQREAPATRSGAGFAHRRRWPARAICLCLWPLLPIACPLPAWAQAGDAANLGPVDRRSSQDAATMAPGSRPEGEAGWTLKLEAVAFTRSEGGSQLLVSTLPGAATTFGETEWLAGAEVFSSNQFDPGRAVGPRISLEYRADTNLRLELAYLAIPNLAATRTVGPEDPVNWYVMRAPGFWQTQDFYYQGMTWAAKTDLRSVEANARFEVARRLELLAGLRWLRLEDSLTGSLTPTDTHEPVWKQGSCATGPLDRPASILGMHLPGTARPCASGDAVDGYPPFWTTTTTNDLFGLQAGAEGTFATFGSLSLGGVVKAGIYGNRARQEAAVSMKKQMFDASAQHTRPAFVGQGAIQATYHFTKDLSATFGYEVLWLDRVALAPGQISRTVSVPNPASVTATGVDTGSSLLLQGFTAGIAYAF